MSVREGQVPLDVFEISLAKLGHIEVIGLPLVRGLYDLLEMECQQRLGRLQCSDEAYRRRAGPLACGGRGRLLAGVSSESSAMRGQHRRAAGRSRGQA
jgi:hypothetical protein